MVFTPDGGRVVLGLITGQVLIIELVEDEENVEVEVVKCFERKERVVRGRVIKGKNVNGNSNGVKGGRNAADDIDVSMADEADEQKSNSGSESESESESDSDSPSTFYSNGAHKQTQNEWISTLAVSEDGQWLGVADLEGRVEVFNLDSLQVSIFFYSSLGRRKLTYQLAPISSIQLSPPSLTHPRPSPSPPSRLLPPTSPSSLLPTLFRYTTSTKGGSFRSQAWGKGNWKSLGMFWARCRRRLWA